MALLTLEQAAAVLSISTRHLLYFTEDGEIPFINIGRGQRTIRRYDPLDIQDFINRRRMTSSKNAASLPRKRRRVGKAPTFEIVDFEKITKDLRQKKKEKRLTSRNS